MRRVVDVHNNRDTLEIHLFGGFSVQFEGTPLPPLPSRTGRLLFAFLALRAGTPQQRSRLADLYWPDVSEARARRRLSHVLWQVQDVLAELVPDRTFVTAVGDTVTFDGGSPYWLDVEEFSQRLERVEREGVPQAAAERELRRCVELYRGDLLAGYYEPWVIAEQTRLSHRYVTALAWLVESCKTRGNYDDALTFARRITHEAPLREDVHREVMRLCVLLGQTGQALEQYERCRSVLAEELGTEPDAETRALAQRVAATRAVPSLRPTTPRFVSKRLVGRAAEREALLDELEATLGGRGRFVLVEGSPGVGKSRLLAELDADASWRGFSVLWGTCGTSRGSVAYAPIKQALGSQLNAIRVAQLRHSLDPVWLDVAGRVLPQLADGERAPAPLSGAEQSERMQEALTRVVLGMADQSPTVLVVEDLHWADDETVQLLRRLASHRDLGRLLVVVSFRDRQVRDDETVWSAMRAIDRDARPRRLRLSGLTAFETDELVAEALEHAEVPRSLSAALHRESGGNPLFALELLRAMRDRGDLRSDGAGTLDLVEIPVTTDLRAVVAERLEALDATARNVVETAAVAGTEFSIDLLSHAAGLDLPDLAGAVQRLLAANLLEEAERGSRFAHAVTRRVVLQHLEPDRLRALHGAVGEALAALEPDAAEALARHFAEAGQPRRAIGYAITAADRALAISGYATAARHLQMADQLMRTAVASTDERFTLLTRWEQVLDVLGDRTRQQEVLGELADLAAHDPDRQVDVHQRQALYLGNVDEFADAEQHARSAVELTPDPSHAQYARSRMILAQLMSWSGDNADAVSFLSGVVEHIADDDPSSHEVRFVLGTAQRFVQDYPAAETQLQRALSLAEEAGDQRTVVQAVGALADLHSEIGRTDEAVAEYDRAIASARQIGYRHREGVGLVNRGNLLWTTGHPVDAAASYDDAEAIFAALGNERGVAMARMNRAWLRHRWFGADDDATRDAEQALAYFAEVSNRGSEAICREILAAVARRQGDHAQAEQHLNEALREARQAAERRAEIQVLRGAAELALARGQCVLAAEHARTGRRLAVDIGLADVIADLASLEGLAVAETDPAAAWTCAEAAIDALVYALEPHRIHHRVAQLALTTGREQLAVQHAGAARRAYESALTGVSEREADRATRADDEHRALCAMAETLLPREVETRMAPREAPRGRELRDDEYVTVHLRLGPPPTSPAARQRQLLDVLAQADDHGATATVAGLASLFDVSPSTIKRDLTRLRATGHDATTRGTGIG